MTARIRSSDSVAQARSSGNDTWDISWSTCIQARARGRQSPPVREQNSLNLDTQLVSQRPLRTARLDTIECLQRFGQSASRIQSARANKRGFRARQYRE